MLDKNERVNVELTVNDICLVRTSLKHSIAMFENHLSRNGNLDYKNQKLYEDLKVLKNEIDQTYFK